ncbi:LexA family transcriptional regulator [Streptococcus anginosus]|uniref:LexA family transcriptional regulator n=1 Tax=Streptococcus anginosus TaxID=1328 RepID=UPI003CF07925
MARGRGKLTPHELEAMKVVSNNLQKILFEKNLKQSQIADALNIPRSTFNDYIKGNTLPIPGNVQKIADYFGLLKSDIDPRFASANTSPTLSTTAKAISETVERLEEPRRVIVLDTAKTQLEEQKRSQKTEISEPLTEYHVFEKLSAGNGYDYMEDRNYDVVFYNKDIDHDFASWVYGDSMEPKFLDGSVALIKDTGWDYDGAIYAVDWDGQSYIKKVYKEKDGLRLVSINDKYDDKFAKWEEEPRIIGKVVGNFMPVER